jgi:hypothetical protein
VSGVRRVRNPAVLDAVTVRSRQLLERYVTELTTEIMGVLEEGARNASGRIYRRASGNGTYQASADNQPPATDTGRLKNSIQARKRNEDVWEVGPARESFEGRFPYPVTLEFGEGRLKAPRPFMRPGVARFKAKLS